MEIFDTAKKMKNQLNQLPKNKTIGFVPTMGALHEGHLSLIKKAKKENDYIVVSIFVNPTQFDNQEDLIKYPKTLNKDLDLLQSVACDYVFTPDVDEIYKGNITASNFDFGGIENEMEGKFRKGHFNGVGTIVKRLFEIVKPNKAYFGKKDFQQLQIIKKLTEIEAIPTEIIACKIYREKDGLAMSSRNTRLTKEQREAAPFIHKILKKVKNKFGTKNAEELTKWVTKKFKKHPILQLEYFIIADENSLKESSKKEKNKNQRAFIAVYAGDIRLIDNIGL